MGRARSGYTLNSLSPPSLVFFCIGWNSLRPTGTHIRMRDNATQNRASFPERNLNATKTEVVRVRLILIQLALFTRRALLETVVPDCCF